MASFIDYISTMCIAMLPIIELKGAIPIGMGMGLPLWGAFWIALLGSSIPVPFILIFIEKIIHMMTNSRIAFFNKFSNWLLGKVEKHKHKIEKYGYLAIFIFVAVPLPGTGVWTGSLLSAMLDLKPKKAFPVIIAGNVIAGLIILAISYGAFAVFS